MIQPVASGSFPPQLNSLTKAPEGSSQIYAQSSSTQPSPSPPEVTARQRSVLMRARNSGNLPTYLISSGSNNEVACALFRDQPKEGKRSLIPVHANVLSKMDTYQALGVANGAKTKRNREFQDKYLQRFLDQQHQPQFQPPRLPQNYIKLLSNREGTDDAALAAKDKIESSEAKLFLRHQIKENLKQRILEQVGERVIQYTPHNIRKAVDLASVTEQHQMLNSVALREQTLDYRLNNQQRHIKEQPYALTPKPVFKQIWLELLSDEKNIKPFHRRATEVSQLFSRHMTRRNSQGLPQPKMLTANPVNLPDCSESNTGAGVGVPTLKLSNSQRELYLASNTGRVSPIYASLVNEINQASNRVQRSRQHQTRLSLHQPISRGFARVLPRTAAANLDVASPIKDLDDIYEQSSADSALDVLVPVNHELQRANLPNFVKRIQSQETKFINLIEKRSTNISNKASENFFPQNSMKDDTEPPVETFVSHANTVGGKEVIGGQTIVDSGSVQQQHAVAGEHQDFSERATLEIVDEDMKMLENIVQNATGLELESNNKNSNANTIQHPDELQKLILSRNSVKKNYQSRHDQLREMSGLFRNNHSSRISSGISRLPNERDLHLRLLLAENQNQKIVANPMLSMYRWKDDIAKFESQVSRQATPKQQSNEYRGAQSIRGASLKKPIAGSGLYYREILSKIEEEDQCLQHKVKLVPLQKPASIL